MKPLRSAQLIAVAGALMFAPNQAVAQNVQYETVTKMEFPGAMGTMMRAAARLGGGSMESVETTYIKGRKMRTDSDGSSTIFDLDSGRFTLLDHEARTYTTFTMEEMVDRARTAANQAQASRSEQLSDGDGQARVDFRFSVDDAGQRERVSGYDARRFFLTMEADGEAVPEGQTEMQEAGSMIVLTDMWVSNDIPVMQARANFEDVSAEAWANAGAAITEGFAAAFADDPQVQVAFEQSMEEAKKIDGMAVKTTTTFVAVAPGQQFDRATVINPQPSGPSIAQQAGRAAIGGLMGRLGRRSAEPEPAEPAEPTQSVMFSVTSEVRNVSTQSVDASMFEVPAGYTEQAM